METIKTKNYNKTKLACYLGFITQAIAANFAPLIFLKLHTEYGISLGQIALIPTAFFLTQLVVDIFCAKFVDKIGYRVSIVASEIFSAAGLIALAFLPDLLPSPFIGIMISVVLYAVGSGLIEVLCSPIIEACPFENKEATMSLLHSFYCWGWVGVTLISTLLFFLFGIDNWKYVACFWSLVPLYNIFNFVTCPIEPIVEEGKGMTILQLLKTPLFWIAVVLMVCSGASEISMAQWASAFVESGIGLSKTFCDLAGPCLFAITMGICRVFYGKFGEKINLVNFMIGSGVLCLFCYILASLSKNPFAALLGCIFCGVSVGIMWPGTLSISSKKIPTGGTAMFALLAMAGDLGGSIGPSTVGMISERAGDNLQKGLLFGGIFPILLIVFLVILKFYRSKEE
ncbi:MAG: MFS transporter [Treponema sp.]|uniref:MFS transporter n=1 Tax=Treponema sp. TaxID=166 RepID=UPI00298D91A8|nr:MFS transporter [Treponema sp.]MCQ2600582.1 MFS transporter [Treponema sp.]